MGKVIGRVSETVNFAGLPIHRLFYKLTLLKNRPSAQRQKGLALRSCMDASTFLALTSCQRGSPDDHPADVAGMVRSKLSARYVGAEVAAYMPRPRRPVLFCY